MSHQVFIERCRDSDPATAESLAHAIASKYGIDPQQILGRLGAGRFRVKANLDLASARRFMEYLESEGALCTIVDDRGDVVVRSAAVTPTPPPDAADDSLALHTPPPPEDNEVHYESGLAAGFGGESDSQDLGVLADAAASSGSLTLSMLDGESSEKKAGPSAGSVAAASDVEAFLPPEMLKEAKLELAEEPAPIAEDDAALQTPAQLDDIEALEDSSAANFGQETASSERPPLALLLVSGRGRLALGVFLAFVLGFLVSSSVASGMEEGQYAKVITELETVYADADSVEAWNELDAVRKTTLGSLERRRRNIVITSLLVWLAAAGLVLFLWMRVINWERVERSLMPEPSR